MSEPSPFSEFGHLIEQIEEHYQGALVGARRRLAEFEARAAGVEAKLREFESAVTDLAERSRAVQGKAADLDEIGGRARTAQGRLQEERAARRRAEARAEHAERERDMLITRLDRSGVTSRDVERIQQLKADLQRVQDALKESLARFEAESAARRRAEAAAERAEQERDALAARLDELMGRSSATS